MRGSCSPGSRHRAPAGPAVARGSGYAAKTGANFGNLNDDIEKLGGALDSALIETGPMAAAQGDDGQDLCNALRRRSTFSRKRGLLSRRLTSSCSRMMADRSRSHLAWLARCTGRRRQSLIRSSPCFRLVRKSLKSPTLVKDINAGPLLAGCSGFSIRGRRCSAGTPAPVVNVVPASPDGLRVRLDVGGHEIEGVIRDEAGASVASFDKSTTRVSQRGSTGF